MPTPGDANYTPGSGGTIGVITVGSTEVPVGAIQSPTVEARQAEVAITDPGASDPGLVARQVGFSTLLASVDGLEAALALLATAAQLPSALDSSRLATALQRSQRAAGTTTISSGQTTSGEIDGRGFGSFALELPAAFTGASISFTGSRTSGGTFQALYDANGDQVSVTVVQGRNYDVPGEVVVWPFWKLVSASAEGAERTIGIVARG